MADDSLTLHPRLVKAWAGEMKGLQIQQIRKEYKYYCFPVIHLPSDEFRLLGCLTVFGASICWRSFSVHQLLEEFVAVSSDSEELTR